MQFRTIPRHVNPTQKLANRLSDKNLEKSSDYIRMAADCSVHRLLIAGNAIKEAPTCC